MVRRYAWAAISEWQCSQGVSQRGRIAPDPHARPKQAGPGGAGGGAEGGGGRGRSLAVQVPMRRARSVACMTQLQAKQAAGGFEEEPDEASSSGGTSAERTASPERCGAGCGLILVRGMFCSQTLNVLWSSASCRQLTWSASCCQFSAACGNIHALCVIAQLLRWYQKSCCEFH
jgi:hypothetical protein